MILRWAEFALDIPARTVVGADGPIHVEPQVFDVLAYLVENRDRVVSKEEILDGVWGDQFVSESALTTRIKNVRNALGDDGRTQKFVRTVHGRGYQFVGEISEQMPAATATAKPVELQLALSIAVDTEYPFVGRKRQLDEIATRFGPAPGSIQVLVGGEPGVGKSRLATEVLERAISTGTAVAAGRCDQNVTSALQPVRDAVSQLGLVYPDQFRRWASGLEAAVVALIPSLTDLLGAEPIAADAYTGLEALVTLIDRASAETRVALLIDDLQWSDEPTRSFLERLQRRFVDRPLLTVATYRSGAADLPSDVRGWIEQQARRENSVRYELGDLDRDDARVLVQMTLDDDQLVDDVLDRAGGNSLFVTESIREIARGGSAGSSVAQSVLSRLDRLDADAQQLVRAGAILGPEFAFALAAGVAELDAPVALEAVDRAIEAGLLHETASASRFRFSHQLVPEAIIGGLSRPRRALVHHRCASVLEGHGASDVEVAIHLLDAVPLVDAEDAVARSRNAARAAAESNQFDRAVRLLTKCLDAGVQTRARAEVLLAIGSALVASGRSEQGVASFEEAAELARKNGWVDVLVDAALGHYGRSPFRRMTDRSTLELLAEASDALERESPGPSMLKARILAKTAAFSVFECRLAARDEMTQRALDMAVDPTPAERLELLESRAISFLSPAGVDEIERLDAELDPLRSSISRYAADAAVPETAILMRGDGDAFRRVAELDRERLRAQPIAEWRDVVLRSTLAAFDGSVEEARRLCDEAASIGEPFWGESTFPLQAFSHLLIDTISPRWERSLELLELLYTFSGRQIFAAPLVWAAAASGDLDRAQQVRSEIDPRSFRWLPEHILGGNALVAAAEAALLLDDDDLAAAAELALVPLGDLVLGVPWAPSLAAADPLARLAERRGDQVAAAAHRARARDLYTSLNAPSLLVRVAEHTS